jgi:hypothetical protein
MVPYKGSICPSPIRKAKQLGKIQFLARRSALRVSDGGMSQKR